MIFPNTASEIAMQSEANDIIEQKAFEAFNKRDEEISQELITNARNHLQMRENLLLMQKVKFQQTFLKI